MAMETNEIMMRTLERFGLELQGLREDVKAQNARLEVQDQPSWTRSGWGPT